ncbi:MAG: ParA family protein [Oscillospiraceae bacterium]|jgi:chromosome partitioning protein|nr:ParA family protein [Oscillospiraceae bacterium]
MATVISVSNQKGGVAKTTTAANLATGLARHGKRVLAIDADPQHSLTVSLGVTAPDKLTTTLATVIHGIINDADIDPASGIIHHVEGADLMPANISLANTELALVNAMSRETVLRQYIDAVRPLYDFVVIDTPPSLGMLTVNALAASDIVIVPVAARFLDAKGLELLLKSISQIQRKINRNLAISGILLTMVDRRANFTREIITLIEGAYGGNIRIFDEHIPRSVRAAESSATGKSVFTHEPTGKVAAAYESLVREVLKSA